jgi:hypothetical protein
MCRVFVVVVVELRGRALLLPIELAVALKIGERLLALQALRRPARYDG